MIDHLGINCADWEKSKTFYDEVLGVLGTPGNWTTTWPSDTAGTANPTSGSPT